MSSCHDCIHCEVCDTWKNAKNLTQQMEEAETLECFTSKKLFIRLPCELGKTVYRLVKNDCKGFQIISVHFSLELIKMFNITVFETIEEAEQKLIEVKQTELFYTYNVKYYPKWNESEEDKK